MTSDTRAMIIGLLAIAVAGLAVVAVVLLPDSDSQVETMRQQLDAVAARLAAMQAAERPWVATTVTIAGDLTVDADGAHLPLRYELANSGRLPAFNVIVIPSLVNSGGTAPFDIAHELETRCGDVIGSVTQASQRGATMPWDYAIFPGRQVAENERADTAALPPGQAASGPVYLLSCVDYRAGRTTDRHQTGDAFYLRRVSPGAVGGTVDIDLSRRERVPASELRLVPALRGTYAN